MQLASRLGINPIGWTNDDFHDLGDDTSLERCLDEIRDAGYAGCELGRKFPRDAAALEARLAPRGLRLVSGWHSTHVLERDPDEEARALDAHLDLLAALGCRVAIVAECSRVLEIEPPEVLGERVGLRPFRRAGVCLRADRLRDGRRVIHNYGHGGSGFTLSWGCAEAVFDVAKAG
jgi:inosose dehydratase